MNRQRLTTLFLITVSILLLGAVAATSAAVPQGSIRGGVFEDADGDGLCAAARPLAVVGVDVRFENDGTVLTLSTGENGTYGLVAVSDGRWTVTAEPAATWRVTSANPVTVEIGAFERYVHTGIDFCVQRTRLALVPTNVTSGVPLLLGIVSEMLLTTPPPPQPPADLGAVAAEPLPEPTTPMAEWLAYLNTFRTMGGLPLLVEDPALSTGAQLHSRYMVVNDRPIAHSENQANALFTAAGDQAGRNGNIFATTQIEANHLWSTNFWVSAPFHLVPLLDPALQTVGFGRYNEAVGNFHMSAVLDVRSGLGAVPDTVQYPLFFPGDGQSTWVLRHSLYEWPDPASSCSGFARNFGAPIVLQLGDGSLSPRVTSSALLRNGTPVPICTFSELTYSNPDAYEQQTGRTILDERDAVVILPRDPLEGGQNYTVQVSVSGETYTWSFNTLTSSP